MNRLFDLNTAVAGLTIALACGCALAAALTIISRPAQYGARLDALKQRSDEIEALGRSRSDAASYPPGALCLAAPANGATLVKQQLTSAINAAGLTPASVSVKPIDETPQPGEVTPVAVSLEATGGFGGVASLLGRLSTLAPELFLDTVDLKSQISSVHLKLSGRVYCLTSAHH